MRSLTLIEPPLYYLVPGDPDVAHLEQIGNAVLADGMAADPATLREFLRLAGATVSDAPLPDAVANGVRRAHHGRLPGQARPDLAAIRAAGVPALVVSGGHSQGLERVCDALVLPDGLDQLRVPDGTIAGHQR